MLGSTIVYGAFLALLSFLGESFPLALFAALQLSSALALYLKNKWAPFLALGFACLSSFYLLVRFLTLEHPLLLIIFILSQIYIGFMAYKMKLNR